ncbi:hypothetical protein [Calothrix sp. 336/3]|uniref:hypothetical protein n=1 Tax=Calothrix sp. 336/3 TaxID=1337936 RepID=UPI001EE12C1B|nr:hypothetical protein [Calothrix sp. 336/3]
MTDKNVLFTSNQAERDLRMMNVSRTFWVVSARSPMQFHLPIFVLFFLLHPSRVLISCQ